MPGAQGASHRQHSESRWGQGNGSSDICFTKRTDVGTSWDSKDQTGLQGCVCRLACTTSILPGPDLTEQETECSWSEQLYNHEKPRGLVSSHDCTPLTPTHVSLWRRAEPAGRVSSDCWSSSLHYLLCVFIWDWIIHGSLSQMLHCLSFSPAPPRGTLLTAFTSDYHVFSSSNWVWLIM